MREITINQINQGGIADSKYEGASNSVAKSVCLDLHTLPGVIQANYELKKDSGTTIDELCKSIVVSSNEHVYFFSSESGKIWRKSSSNVYSLYYTTAAPSGESKILGAIEYEGYIYWATEESLFRVTVGSTDWGSLQPAWDIDTVYTETDIVSNGGANYKALAEHDNNRVLSEATLRDGITDETKISHGSIYYLEGGVVSSIVSAEVAFTATTDDITADSEDIQEAIYLIYMDTGGVVKILKGDTAGEGLSTCPDLPAGAIGKLGELKIQVSEGSTDFDATTDELTASHLTTTYTNTDPVTLADTEPGVGDDWEDYWEVTLTDYAVKWRDFDIGNAYYHPMTIARNKMWIGDGYKVANVAEPLGGGDPVFIANALDLPSGQIIKALGSIDIQLAIGTYVDDNVNKTSIYRWDTWSPSYNMDDTIEEVGINAFIPVDNYFFVQAGKVGSIYSYDYNMLYLTKRVPGTYNMTYASRVSPNAVAFQKQLPLFGMSRDESAAQSGATPGVYSLGTVNPRLYHRILNLEYLTSTNSNTTVIGAIAVRGNQLYVSWKDGTNTGIDTIDYSNRYNGAYLESRVIYLDRTEANVYTNFNIGYVEMPTDCSVKAYIKQNYASSWTELTLTQDTIRNRFYSELRLESSVVEFKVELETSGADSPIIDYISLTGEDEGDQGRYRV